MVYLYYVVCTSREEYDEVVEEGQYTSFNDAGFWNFGDCIPTYIAIGSDGLVSLRWMGDNTHGNPEAFWQGLKDGARFFMDGDYTTREVLYVMKTGDDYPADREIQQFLSEYYTEIANGEVLDWRELSMD